MFFFVLNPKRAKSLRNIVTVNRQRSNYELLQIIEMLKKCAPSPALRRFAAHTRVRAAAVLISRDVHVVSRELLAMKKYAEYLEEELRKLKGPNWKPSMPRPNFVRQLPRRLSVDPI